VAIAVLVELFHQFGFLLPEPPTPAAAGTRSSPTESAGTESRPSAKQIALQPTQASANVANLQKRVAGVLPIPIDVPKAGNSYRFIRPLVVDEETKLTFAYRAGR